MDKKVTMYTTPNCGWCRVTKKYFEHYGVKYSEIDVAADQDARAKMFEKSKQMGVPVIDIDGEIVIGFNQPRLSELLGITG